MRIFKRIDCGPRSLGVRFFILFVSSFFFFAVTGTDELVGAAIPTLKETMHLDSTQIAIMYSCTPIVGIFSTVFTSAYVGKIGIARLTVLASFTALVGTLVFILSSNYYLKLLGRALFGLGEGPLEIVMELICMRWFKEGDSAPPSLEFAFGVGSSAGMLGGVAGLNVIPWLLERFADNVTAGMLVFSSVPLVAFLLAVIYWYLDTWATPLLGLKSEDEEEEFLTIIKALPKPYWILFVLSGSLWSLLYVLLVFLTDFLHEKWGMSNLEAGQYSSLVFLIGIIVSLATGSFVSRYGQIITGLYLGGIIFTCSCAIMALTKVNPLVGILGLGVSMGLYEPCLYTAIALVSPEKGQSVAFAFSAVVFQLSLFVIPFVVGFLHDTFNSYDAVFILAGFSGIFNVLLSLSLGSISPHLQQSQKQRETLEANFGEIQSERDLIK